MFKRSKLLSRIYIGLYIIWLFGCLIFSFLMAEYSVVLSIILIVLNLVVLAGIIVSNVYKNKNMKKEFILSSLISVGTLLLFVLIGFVLELVNTFRGQPATYARISLGISIVLIGIISIFVPRIIKKIKNNEEDI